MSKPPPFVTGDRVIVPDPQAVNPLGGSPPVPHGAGTVRAVIEHPHGGAPLLDVELDTGETLRVGSLFCKRKVSA